MVELKGTAAQSELYVTKFTTIFKFNFDLKGLGYRSVKYTTHQ